MKKIAGGHGEFFQAEMAKPGRMED